MQTWIDHLAFADGTYSFKLGLTQIVEIERKAGAGIGAVFGQCLKGRYAFGLGDPHVINFEEAAFQMPVLIEIIRQGLIGGGSGVVDGARVKIAPFRANELIDAYVLGVGDRGMVLREAWKLAFVVLDALMNGYQPPPPATAPRLADAPDLR